MFFFKYVNYVQIFKNIIIIIIIIIIKHNKFKGVKPPKTHRFHSILL